MRDAQLIYISKRQACSFRTTPEEKKLLQELLEEIEKDGLGNKEPRKYTDISRLSLFQQLYWESKKEIEEEEVYHALENTIQIRLD